MVDPVGGDRFTDSLRCLAGEDRLVVIRFTGREIPAVKVNRLLLTNTTVMGAASEEFWETAPGFVAHQWRDLVPLMQIWGDRPPIGSVFSLHGPTSCLYGMRCSRVRAARFVRTRFRRRVVNV